MEKELNLPRHYQDKGSQKGHGTRAMLSSPTSHRGEDGT